MMSWGKAVKRAGLSFGLALLLSLGSASAIHAEAAPAGSAADGGSPAAQSQVADPNSATVEPEALRGGTYRSPGRSFSGGGTRSGVSPGGTYRTGPRAPSSDVTRNPRYSTPGGGASYTPGRTGTFLGGLAAGALLGHLFNPFGGFGWGGGYGAGYGYGYGFSFISLLIWAVIIYAAYRFIRRIFRGRGGRGPYE